MNGALLSRKLQIIAAFDIADVNPNPSRFDPKKAESINGDHVRMLAADDFAARLEPYLGRIFDGPPSDEQRAVLAQAASCLGRFGRCRSRMAPLSLTPADLSRSGRGQGRAPGVSAKNPRRNK